MTMTTKKYPCWCQGDQPDWDYHSPGGCGKTSYYMSTCGGNYDNRIDFEEHYNDNN